MRTPGQGCRLPIHFPGKDPQRLQESKTTQATPLRSWKERKQLPYRGREGALRGRYAPRAEPSHTEVTPRSVFLESAVRVLALGLLFFRFLRPLYPTVRVSVF